MKPRVQEKLDQIFHYPFFESIGKPLPDSVMPIKTWRRAATECSKIKWGNNQLSARNAIQESIQKQFPKPGIWERLQEWGPLSDELRPLVSSFAESLSTRILLPAETQEKIKYNLAWDFMFICLEIEFSDIVEPGFNLKCLDPWYAAGRFPCGWYGRGFPENWDGIIRQGRLMVF